MFRVEKKKSSSSIGDAAEPQAQSESCLSAGKWRDILHQVLRVLWPDTTPMAQQSKTTIGPSKTPGIITYGLFCFSSCIQLDIELLNILPPAN